MASAILYEHATTAASKKYACRWRDQGMKWQGSEGRFVDITIHRGVPVAREMRVLAAGIYNQAHALLARSRGVVFVPVRSMQFLVIIDSEEMLFVDHLYKNEAALTWHLFRPQDRSALDEPVVYEAVYYRDDFDLIMGRLQAEFPQALKFVAGKGGGKEEMGTVIPFRGTGRL